MKNLINILSVAAVLLVSINSNIAQRGAIIGDPTGSIVLPPSTSICLEPTADAIVHQVEPNVTHGSGQNLTASRWTYAALGFSGYYTVRSLIKFNLASIPANATITSATLTLYNCPSCYYPNHQDLSGLGNSVNIKPVLSAWTEAGVTWNTKPTVGSGVSSANFGNGSTANLTLGVASLVQNMLTTNNGFEMSLASNADYYHSANFATRENANAALRPKLCITYTVPIVNVCTFTPIADAALSEVTPTTNYGTTGNNIASRWTFNPITGNYNFFTTNSLVRFDLTSIPSTAIITSATLNLYNCPTCYYTNHQDLSNLGNSVDIARVTSSWLENTVTWNSQPTADWANKKVSANFGNGSTANLAIDVTSFIPSMLCSNDNGFEMRMNNTGSYYHSATFATRENANTALRPKLCVSYYIPTTGGICVFAPNPNKTVTTTIETNRIDDLGMDKVNSMKTSTSSSLYPNPTTGLVTVQHNSDAQFIQVLDMTGKIIVSETATNTQTEIDLTSLSAGMYMVRIDGQAPQKIVKQ
jgi:hypothetical protein